MSQILFDARKEALYRKIVLIISVIIPAVVAFLILVPQTGNLGDVDVSMLPAVNATLNSLTSLCLVVAFLAIKNKNIVLHRSVMSTAFVLSACFLVCYVFYHFQGPQTRFGDLDHNGLVDQMEKDLVGSFRYVYYLILITHIVLAAIVLPFILLSFYFSLSGQLDKHRKIVKFSFPAWLYVAVSGVAVYFMIRPYYPF